MQLAELQRRFQSHLLGGEATVLGQILAAPPLSPSARLEIYRAAYVNRLIEALRSTYVKVHQILGDEVFAAMAADFIATHPSTTRSIRWYGSALPAHLAKTPPYSDTPVIAELARFEWTLADVFDAADAQTLPRSAIAAVDPSRWGNMKFGFHPSVRTVNFDWNAVALWQAIDEESDVPQPLRSPHSVTWLLWRQDFRNYFRSLDAVEQTALAWAMDGATFAVICDELRHRLADDEIPLRAATLIAAWADGGMLTDPLELENMG